MSRKPGDVAPQYEDVDMYMMPSRRMQTKMPWWNPRYWSRKVWIAVVAVVIIVVVIIVAVAVTVTKKNAYPNYTELSYSLKDTYGGEDFFDNFNYFNTFDPAHGFVHYVDEPLAKQYNLTYATADTAVIKVDTTVGPDSEPNASTGRFSVRIESKKTYNNGLFIFDVKHTPYGCATWPALWLVDPANWPAHGEIDIMEATNLADEGNLMTLHTSTDCSMGVKRKMTGSAEHKSCDKDANDNAGCGVAGDKKSFGTEFNANGGGVMAVEWRDAGIRMWQFARDSIPADITSQKPTPDAWGMAAADFPSTDCNIGSHFKNNSIIANIDLCGDLAGATYKDTSCPGNCTDLVANHPEEFKNAYWEFGKFEVYQTS